MHKCEHAYIHTCINRYIYAYVDTTIHACIIVLVYIDICTCIHTQIHVCFTDVLLMLQTLLAAAAADVSAHLEDSDASKRRLLEQAEEFQSSSSDVDATATMLF